MNDRRREMTGRGGADGRAKERKEGWGSDSRAKERKEGWGSDSRAKERREDRGGADSRAKERREGWGGADSRAKDRREDRGGADSRVKDRREGRGDDSRAKERKEGWGGADGRVKDQRGSWGSDSRVKDRREGRGDDSRAKDREDREKSRRADARPLLAGQEETSLENAENEDGSLPELVIEGRNAVLEAFRAGKTIDKLFVLDGCKDGPIQSIIREAKKHDTIISYVAKERLEQLSETGKHQGVIAMAAAYEYAEVEDILNAAKEKGEPPFIFLLDGIEDPHNLGAIIRTANLAGAHGVIIPKRRAVGLTATVARTSAGALNYTPVAKVTNLAAAIEELKKEGLWFVCADMGGELMYRMNLTGPIGLVIGNEGDGVGKLIREKCDMTASIPMKGNIDSLNASVAAGVLAYEIVRQRLGAVPK